MWKKWKQWSYDQKVAVLEILRSQLKDPRLTYIAHKTLYNEKPRQGEFFYWGFDRGTSDYNEFDQSRDTLNNSALVEGVLKHLFPEHFLYVRAHVYAWKGGIYGITIIYSPARGLFRTFAPDIETSIGYEVPAHDVLIKFIDAFVEQETKKQK